MNHNFLKPNPDLDALISEWNRTRPTGTKSTHERAGFSTELVNRSPFDEAARYILHYTDPGDIVLEPQSNGGVAIISGHLCSERAFIEHLEYEVNKAGVVSRDIYIPAAAPPRVENDEIAQTTDGDDDDAELDALFRKIARQQDAGTRIPEPISSLGERRVIVTNHSPLAVLRAQSYVHDLKPQKCREITEMICDQIRNQSLDRLHSLDTTELASIFTENDTCMFSEHDLPILQALRDAIMQSEYAGKLLVPFERTLLKCQSVHKKQGKQDQSDLHPLDIFYEEVRKEANDKPTFDGSVAATCNAPDQIPCADAKIDYALYDLPSPGSLSVRAQSSFAVKFEAWLGLNSASESDSANLFKEIYRLLKPGKFFTVIVRFAEAYEPRVQDASRQLEEAGFELVPNTKTDPPRKQSLVLSSFPLTVLTARKPT